MSTEREFAAGDIVRHTGEFLRSIAWHLDVPINGRVISSQPLGSNTIVRVEWSDGTDCGILSSNIEIDPINRNW